MKFTFNWLKDYLETNASVEEVADKLSMIGLEVEEIINPGHMLKDFIVAEVVSCHPHPDADKLKLLQVNTGKEEIQVVCGAPNVKTGLKGILARPGDYIPAYHEKLGKAKIRGIESQGMLCSAKELCLGEDHSGIIELPATATVGASATTVLNIEAIFHIEVTPNRSECLGVRGIARDLAAAGMGVFKDKTSHPLKGSFKSHIQVDIKDTARCPLFIGRYIKGVKNTQSPQWLKDRLMAIGLRSISALVDITNYFVFDQARPLHVFDADLMTGNLLVHPAKGGEKLTALDENTYTLNKGDIAISDEKGVQSLAGVMGGLDTGCSDTTVNVFLESALFDADQIRKTAKTLGIESDAKYRFERYVDPLSTQAGAELATQMILDLCGGEASDLVIAGEIPSWEKSISFRPTRFAQHIGIDVPKKEMIKILTDLGCSVEEKKENLMVTPPSWRGDLEEEHDVIEEIIRIYGYDKIPSVSVEVTDRLRPTLTPIQKRVQMIRRDMASRGLAETVTWSFTDEKWATLCVTDTLVRLANPISADLNVLRPNGLVNLLLAVQKNQAKGFENLAFFEIGPTFYGDQPGEQNLVLGAVRSERLYEHHWQKQDREVDFMDAKADFMAALKYANLSEKNIQMTTENLPTWAHPGRSASVVLGKKILGTFGQIHPFVQQQMDLKGPVVCLEVLLENLPKKQRKATAKPLLTLSAFQPVHRDFSFIVQDNVRAKDLMETVLKVDPALIKDCHIFDVYEGKNVGENKKSIALRVDIQPVQKTLTDQEIDVLSNKIISALEKNHQAELRKV